MTGLELNLFGLALIVMQFAFHFYTFARTYLLFTMHPSEGNLYDRIVAVGAMSLFVLASVIYGVQHA